MQTKVNLDKYIINVKGKDFITLNGLLAEAHAVGIQSMDTQFINSDIQNPVFKTTVTLKDGRSFSGWGDASKNSVAPMVQNCLVRMAESRSISRCLRFALNIDLVAIEELGNEDDVIGTKQTFVTKSTTSFTKAFNTSPKVETPVKSSTFVKKTFVKPSEDVKG